jgi:Flp pilus assembly protein TadD
VYGIALNSRGQAELALEILNDSRNLHQRDRDILWALATINRDAGNIQEAKAMARELVMLFPGDNAAKQLLKTL